MKASKFFLAALSLAALSTASAQVIWTGPNAGVITTAANWSTSTLPTISNNRTGTINAGANVDLPGAPSLIGYQITQNGGTVSRIGGSRILDGGYYTLAGGNFTVQDLSLFNTNIFTVSGGNATITGTLATGTVSNAQIIVSSGLLAAGPIDIRSGGSLSVSGGTVTGSALNLGFELPSPLASTLTLSGGSTVISGNLAFAPASSGTASTNSLAFSGASELSINSILYNGTDALNDSFVNVATGWSGFFDIGSFTTISQYYTALVDNGKTNTFRLNNTAITDAVTFDNNFDLNGSNALILVPEPSTWALLAVSLTTVMILRRRRHS